MQTFIELVRKRVPEDGILSVEQHRAMHEALLARRPVDADVQHESATLGGVPAGQSQSAESSQ